MSFLTFVALSLYAACVSVAAEPASAAIKCHNITGTCLPQGFICANNEVVRHDQRCNGVEECADGTDEFMCHAKASPLADMHLHERVAHAEMSCIKCNCQMNILTIGTAHSWWQYAKFMPLTPTFMTTPTNFRGRQCHPTFTNAMTVAFYKKNTICRGWLCCARQNSCTACNSGMQTTQRCYA